MLDRFEERVLFATSGAHSEMTLATTGWMQVSRGEEEMVWAVPAAPSGIREKQLHKPDLENSFNPS